MSRSELLELRKLRNLSLDTNDNLDIIMHQNGIIISLLGRMAFTPEVIREIVTKRKRNPEKYIEGYNCCSGEFTVTDLATIIGVSQPTMSKVISQWEELGIIYEVTKPNGKFYKKLFPI
jgi:DNA-binding MarR family transcriptional regulator